MKTPPLPLGAPAALICAFSLFSAGCGSGSGTLSSTVSVTPSLVQVSASSALGTTCGLAVGDPAASPPETYTLGAAVQPQLAVNPQSMTQLVGVWEQDRWDAIGARAIDFAASHDGGLTWGAIAALPFSTCAGGSGAGAAYDRASDPSISVGNGGVVFASALAFSAGGFLQSGGSSAVLVARSTDAGASWSSPLAAIADTGTGVDSFFNDRDAIAADPNGKHVYLLWDRIDNAAQTQATWLAHSGDSGLTWDPARPIYNPGVQAGTFNNQPLVLANGTVVDIFTQVALSFSASTPLMLIRSVDNGTTWTSPGGAVTVANMTPVATVNPANSALPIRDSANMAQTAVDPVNSTLAAVWEESSFSGGARNGIAFTVSGDGGNTWSAPLQVNTAHAVAAFNPSVHFGTGGRIAVTYYDFRDYLGGTALSTDFWLVESVDGGKTWSEKKIYGPFDLNQAPPADQNAGTTGNALFLGDQQGLAWNGSAWAALFAATGGAGARVYLAVQP